MKFRYYVELHEGYQSTCMLEAEYEVEFIIEAKNRVTADRMVNALLKDGNIKEIGGICIEQ